MAANDIKSVSKRLLENFIKDEYPVIFQISSNPY